MRFFVFLFFVRREGSFSYDGFKGGVQVAYTHNDFLAIT